MQKFAETFCFYTNMFACSKVETRSGLNRETLIIFKEKIILGIKGGQMKINTGHILS